MPSILVADKIAESGLQRLRQEGGVSIEVRPGLTPPQLAEIVGGFDGMLIRSAVKVTAEVLANPGRLSAIARAGVGVDNVDLDAATAAGVLVLNTPDANTISTAEHTVALILALHRRIPDSHHHVVSGLWNRSAFEGAQVAGRTLGIVGFGRIGQAVAKRAIGLEMEVMAFDPFVRGTTAMNGAVTLVADLKTLLSKADCVTLHAALTADNEHMMGAEQLGQMKPGARLINCARGALIDEAALAAALNSGRIAGAGVDVYENEPPKGSPLLQAKNMVFTPHLAASTAEAQERVSIDAADALLAYLLRGEIRSAVNVAGIPSKMSGRGRAFVDLCGRMGTILSLWFGEGVQRIQVETVGESLESVGPTLAWQAMASIVGPHLHGRLNLVNARDEARRRGIDVQHVARVQNAGQLESVTVRVESRGEQHVIEGTVFADGRPRIVAIDGYRMEVVPERAMVIISNEDRPGVIGLVGQRFGDAGINIADMALSRQGNTALMVLKVDKPMPEALRESLQATKPPIISVHSIVLPPAPPCPSFATA